MAQAHNLIQKLPFRFFVPKKAGSTKEIFNIFLGGLLWQSLQQPASKAATILKRLS